MNVISMQLSELVMDPENTRTHNKKNMEAIVNSLEEFGQVEPLVVRTGTNVVVGGNGRLAAMQALGWEEASVALQELTDDQAKALSIALNRTGELAEWDYEQLSTVLKSLDEGLLDSVGWSSDEIENLVAADWTPEPIEDDALNTDDGDGEAKEGAMIRMSIEQRALFEVTAEKIRGSEGDLKDGAVVALLCALADS